VIYCQSINWPSVCRWNSDDGAVI